MRRIETKKRSGFSLIEVLLAVAIGAMIMTAATSLLFSTSHLWFESENLTVVDEHVVSLTHFVEHAFSAAEVNEESDSGAISWGKIPGDFSIDGDLLTFRLTGDLPIFVEEGSFLPEVNCYLKFREDQGLYLIWQSDAMAEENAEDFRETLLSPWVKEMLYCYYDEEAESWDSSDKMESDQDGNPKIPEFLKLKFISDDSTEQESFILLPNANSNVPSY